VERPEELHGRLEEVERERRKSIVRGRSAGPVKGEAVVVVESLREEVATSGDGGGADRQRSESGGQGNGSAEAEREGDEADSHGAHRPPASPAARRLLPTSTQFSSIEQASSPAAAAAAATTAAPQNKADHHAIISSPPTDTTTTAATRLTTNEAGQLRQVLESILFRRHAHAQLRRVARHSHRLVGTVDVEERHMFRATYELVRDKAIGLRNLASEAVPGSVAGPDGPSDEETLEQVRVLLGRFGMAVVAAGRGRSSSQSGGDGGSGE
jgi:hypothetical protein